MADKEKITHDDLKRVQEAMREIPFGNSAFQIEHFVAQDHSPERAYRKVLLEFQQKMVVLEATQIRRRRLDVDLREIEDKLKTATGFDKERLEIDRDEKLGGIFYEDKLIEDALVELALYYAFFESLPKFTREQFEKAELPYWKTRLLHEAQLEVKQFGRVEKGTLDSLERIGVETKIGESGIEFLEAPRKKEKDA